MLRLILCIIIAITMLLTACSAQTYEDKSSVSQNVASSEEPSEAVPSSSASEPHEDTEPVDEVITDIPSSQPSSSTPQGRSAAAQSTQNDIYTATANPAKYETTAIQITVEIQNISKIDGSYSYAYHIEHKAGSRWEPIPFEFNSNRDASILPAGQKLTAKFDLYPVHEDIAFVPGKYRVVLDGFDGVSAEFAIIDSDSEPNSGQMSGEPIYEVKPKLGVYDVDAESITVHITNTSDTEGGYGRYYRIEEKLGDVWTPLPLEIIVTEDWFILPPGETQTQTYNLFRDQHDYSPGTTYRIVLTGVAGEPSVVFELQE